MMTAPEPDGIVWHTSSYSSNGGTCVEVGWRTSSYSASHGNCVEVAPAPDRVLVCDSKDRDGPTLTVPTAAWRAFLTTITRYHPTRPAWGLRSASLHRVPPRSS